MKIAQLLSVPAILICFATAAGASTTYYVSPSGSDSNAGTSIAPFKTIGKGITSAVAGDTVSIADGTYSGTGNVDLSISAAITVTSANGAGSTVVDCGGAHKAFALSAGTSGSPIVIKGLTIQNGTSAGVSANVVGMTNAVGQFMSCRFMFNQPWGALSVPSGSTATVASCEFASNTGFSGGAIYCGGTLSVGSSTFSGNQSTGYGGVAYNVGSASFYQCTFDGNSTPGNGGAVSNLGILTVTNCLFHGNQSASNGGAIFTNSAATISNTSILGNNAANGGGIWNAYTFPITIKNCVIALNSAADGGGLGNAGQMNVDYSTIAGNSASNGADDYEQNGATVTLRNDILWGNGVSDLYNNGNTSITNCDLTSNAPATNSINADPQFVDAANGDYSVRATSPCRHAAIVINGITTDYFGRPRSASSPTIGAVEGGQGGEFVYVDGVTGSDGGDRQLWLGLSDDAGYFTLWRVVPPAAPTTTHKFGPFNYGRPLFVAVGPNLHERVLLFDAATWMITLFDIAPNLSYTTLTLVPYTNTIPTSMSVGSDNHVHLVFTSSSGTAINFNVSTDGSHTSKTYGPY